MGAIQLDFKLPFARPVLGKIELEAVRSEIILGSPSAGCTGVGLCRIMTVRPTTIRYKCPVVSAWLSLTNERRLRVSFMKNSMELKVQRRHFRWGLFQVLEAYEMPDEMARCLPGLAEYTVQPGIYTVWETAEHLVVDF